MATWEFQLLSRIVRHNELQRVIQWGITEEDFLTNEGRSLFRAVLGYHMMPETRGSTLGPMALHAHFPTVQLIDDYSMTTDALCAETRKHRLRIDLRAQIQKGLEMVDLDPLEAAGTLCKSAKDIINIGMNKNVDVHFSMAFQRSVDRSKAIAQGADFSVAAWPWAPLQRATMGLQYDDYVILYGRPKSMKSWLLAFIGACLFDQNKRLLIYTKEMTPDNIFQRIGCILAGVDYDRFRNGTCTVIEWISVEGTMRLLMSKANEQVFVCLNGQAAPSGGDTVEWLDSKIDQYAPDAVLIDGLYLMSDSKGSKKLNDRVRNISNGLRNLVLHRNLPIIATIQANREAAKNTEANLDEIGFSDAIGQDTTLAMRCINEHRSSRPTLAVIVGGSRECRIEGFRVWGKPAVDFSDFVPGGQEMTGREVEQARTDDATDPKNGNANGAGARKSTPTENVAVANTNRQIDQLLRKSNGSS